MYILFFNSKSCCMPDHHYSRWAQVNFTKLKPRMTMARTLKLYKLPDTTSLNLELTETRDVPSLTVLLNNYLSK